MSSKDNIANVNTDDHTDDPEDILECAQLNSVIFHSKLFTLNIMNQQQDRISGPTPSYNPSKVVRPHAIEEIVSGPCSDEVKKQLGENLLDSFALIFARPGSDGVTATAMEWDSKNPSRYILHVARNSGEDSLSSYLVSRIQVWFETPHDNYVDNPDITNEFWQEIVQSCYPNIKKSMFETCYVKLQNVYDKDEYPFEDLRNLIIDVACTKSDDEIPPQAKGLVYVLDIVYYLSDYDLVWTRESTYFRLGDLTSIPTKKDLKLIHKLIHICYELLESYLVPMDDLIHQCRRRCREIGYVDRKIEYPETFLLRTRRLVHIIAEYRRAWFDMVRFKIDHREASLQIRIVPLDKFTVSMKLESIGNEPYRTEVSKIINELEECIAKCLNNQSHSSVDPSTVRRKPRDLSWQGRILKIWDHAPFVVHCEMQILELLLRQGSSKFFNYIGCSKGACWLCYHAITMMAPEFTRREPHLKLYPRWLMMWDK
ncbi:uncharacterized protein GGS22DRAFT_200429 [Annulohypoxylon maeteangense]|uniref:uncharacterized protein n=1 Tax=Annulohypoxylon maeteangense TaxID=1927788 RepID=UPI0020085864|nr:uncharacterized protein GGS22DRAFT_200429 [Annulohypoxylon maeteangense]KAI0884733.1 hypothetical protein GGS22DRAFT_200429 [Annulohypoxylon maeteangense]